MSSYQGARLQTDHRSCVISWQNLNIETYLTMILSRSSSNSVDKEISLTPSLILADDLLAQAQIEMQTCSVRRQNKVADRSSHNRCGTAVATAASVEILAKENHHAFSSSKCFTKFVSILDCLETIFPMLATCELAIHPTRPHIPKQHQAVGADAALAMHGFQHPPGQSRGGGGPSDVNVILVCISMENCEPSLVLVKPMDLLQLLDRVLLCIGGVTKIIQFSLLASLSSHVFSPSTNKPSLFFVLTVEPPSCTIAMANIATDSGCIICLWKHTHCIWDKMYVSKTWPGDQNSGACPHACTRVL